MCDGNNSTPDLRSRFVVGAGSGGLYSVGDTGGSRDAVLVSHSHTVNNHTHSFSGSSSHSHTVNNHTHSFSGSGSSSHSHGIPKGRGGSQANIQNYVPTPKVEQVQASFSSDSASVSISISGTTGGSSPGTNSQTVSISGTTGGSSPGTNSQGSSATNANLPPYLSLIHI